MSVLGRVSAQHLVRTDSREQKLDAFLVSHQSAPRTPDPSTTDDFALPQEVSEFRPVCCIIQPPHVCISV